MISTLKEKYKRLPQQAKASFWFAFCSFVQRGISFITTPIFTRLLSTSDYGILSVYSTWENIILIIASLNLAAGVYLRGLIKYDDDREGFTSSLQSLFIVVMTVVFLIFIIFSDFWANLIDLPKLYIYLMFVDMYLVTAFQFWSARQRVDFQYRNLVLVTMTNAVLKPILGIALVLSFENKAEARIIAYIICDIVVFGYFLATVFVGKTAKFSTKYWKYALGYNLPLVPHYLSQIVLNQSDRVMIKEMVDTSSAGIYSLAYTLATILLIVNQSILNTYNPWMYKKIKDQDYKSINKISVALLLLIAGLNLLLIGFAPEAIAILAPKTYYDAIWIIPSVAASVYFTFLYSLFSNFEFYFEKTKLMMIASVCCAGLNLILNYIFIQKYGYIAAGYTTLFCYICYSLFHYLMMKQIIKRTLCGVRIYDEKKILVISFIFVLFSGGFMVMYRNPILRYSILGLIIISVTIYRKKLLLLFKDLLAKN